MDGGQLKGNIFKLTEPNRSKTLSKEGEIRIHFRLDPFPTMKVDEFEVLWIDLHVETRLGSSDDLVRSRLENKNHSLKWT